MATRTQVEKEFKKLVADIFRTDVKKLKDSTNYAMDLRAKSLSMITLVAATESKFGIKTSPMETAKNTTVKKSIDYIMKKLKEKEPKVVKKATKKPVKKKKSKK